MNKRHLLFALLTSFLLISSRMAYSQAEGMEIRMLTYNIRHGAGMDDKVDLNRQAAVIQGTQPDVVGLQEVDSCVKRSGYIPEAKILGDALGMYSTFGAAIPLTGGKYGVAILSKERPLSVHHLPLPGVEKRTLLVCEFENYVFATTHLDLNDSCRFASLPIILEEAASWEKPFFICGDWNDEPASALIKQMRKDGFVFLNGITSSSLNYTFPAPNPNKTIDYITSFGRVTKSTTARKVIKEPEASDHRPVLVGVTIELPTSIQSPSTSVDDEKLDEIYDLTGKKVENENLLPGLYIQKNKRKKFVIR